MWKLIFGEEETYEVHRNSADESISTQKSSINSRIYDIFQVYVS
jgi:hypothetical protein